MLVALICKMVKRANTKLFNYRPLPMMLLFGIVGILAVSLLDFVLPLIILCAFIVTISIFAFIKKCRKYILRLIVLLLTFILFTCVGGAVISNANEYQAPIYSATITAIVDSTTSVLEQNDEYTKYQLIVTNVKYSTDKESGTLKGKARGYLETYTAKEINVGDKVVLVTDITPKVTTLIGSTKVYGKYTTGISYTLDNISFKEVVPQVAEFHESMRSNIKESLTKIVPSGGVMYSMLFGDNSTMESEFISSSRKTGIAHLFAVSGLHLGIVASIVGFFCKKCKANKWIDFIVVILLSGIYAYLVGFGVSVLRAYLMLIIYKLGRIFGLRSCGISSLSLSSLIILLINPLSLFDVSFQLSVMAIVGLLFFEKPIRNIIRTRFKWFNSFVSVNLSVNISILPVMLHYFGSVSLIFFIANLLIVPLVTLIFPLIFVLVLLTALIPQIAYALIPFGYIFSLVETIITYLASIKFFAINVRLSAWLALAYLLVIMLLSTYSMLTKKPKIAVASILSVLLVTTIVLTSFGRMDGSIKLESILTTETSEILMLDVKEEHYLIVNGELNKKDLYTCSQYVYTKNYDNIDGIIKASFNNKEKEVAFEYKSKFKIEQVITSVVDKGLNDIFKDNVIYSKNIGECEIMPLTEYVIKLCISETQVLLVDNRENQVNRLPKETDILYCLGDIQKFDMENIQYYVSNIGVEKLVPKAIGSHNSFVIKKEKIKLV